MVNRRQAGEPSATTVNGPVGGGGARAPPPPTGTTRGTIPEIWFPRLIVVPVYSQEVAGVRKEKERLTAAADSFSFIRTRAATFFLTVRGCRVYGRDGGSVWRRAHPHPSLTTPDPSVGSR